MSKTRVLFLCTGNSARSQIAEAFLRKYGGNEIEAYSAGLEPEEINPNARYVMEEVGTSLNGQYSKHIREYMDKVHFAYVVTLCEEAEASCPTTFPGIFQRLYWPFEDPAAFKGPEDERLARFRRVRDQIEQRIKAWLAEQKAT